MDRHLAKRFAFNELLKVDSVVCYVESCSRNIFRKIAIILNLDSWTQQLYGETLRFVLEIRSTCFRIDVCELK